MAHRRTTTMRIDDELLDGLQAVKERDGVPVSEQVRRAIQAWLQSKGIPIAKAADRKRATSQKRI